MAGLIACASGEFIPFVEEDQKSGPQFVEGAQDTVYVDDTVVLHNYIEYDYNEEYKITMTSEDGVVQDLTREVIWYSEVPGTFTLTYTYLSGWNQGSNTFTIHVIYPELEFQFSLQNKPYMQGDTLVFEDYFADMNVWASLPNTEIAMESVTVDGETISLAGEESYTFTSRSDHTFRFFAKAADGQVAEGREVISIKYINEERLSELEANDISLAGELYVEDDGVITLQNGMYANGNNVILQRANGPHKSPYIAYNGDYGIGSYVKVDFTGKNMPIFSFFRDEYSQSMFDGSKGIVFTGGLKNNSGEPSHPTLTNSGVLYGPNMLHKPDEAFNTTYNDTAYIADSVNSGDDPHPISLQGLVDGTRYRMMIGFSGIEETSSNHLFTKEPISAIRLILDCALINLDSMEIVTKFTMRTYALQALGFEDVIPTDTLNNEYFVGNIVLYGNNGDRTVIDKVYPVVDTYGLSTFEEAFAEEFAYSQFNAGAKTSVLGSSCTIKLEDYIDVDSNYVFYYTDEEGVRHDVDGESFTLNKAGGYVFYYTNGENLCSSLPFSLINVSDSVKDWLATENINLHGIESITDSKAVTLKAGTVQFGANYQGPNAGNVIDQAFLAFDGNYSYNDFIAFDFTGKNMPEVAFFAQNYNNSMYYQDGGKQGMVFVSGITNADGSIDKNILKNGDDGEGGSCVNVHSPFMIDDAHGNWLMEGGAKYSALARANLVDGKHYRVVLGFTYEPVYNADGVTVDRIAPKMNWYLYDVDTKEVVERGSFAAWNWFNGSTEKVNFLSADDLFGSIVLYGKFGTTLKVDKIYGVFEDTTLDAVASAINGDKTFTATFKDLNGDVLKTVSGITTEQKVAYGDGMPTPSRSEDSAFTYDYVWDKPLSHIAQDTVYNLTIAAKPKDNVSTYKALVNGATIKLNTSWIGDGANYTLGQNNGGGVDQSYFAIDGNYSLNTYVAFDFTGKNMPEIAFFAKNYDKSMYADGTSKQGIVVVTGITMWNGTLGSGVNGNGTQINYGFPYMIQNAANGEFTQGAFASSKLGRANLVDGKRYRVVMGFTGSDKVLTLNWLLYDLDQGVVVEQSSMSTHAFFDGTNPKVGNMTLDDLTGSIVLYGKFGAETYIDRFCGIYENSSIDEIVTELDMN